MSTYNEQQRALIMKFAIAAVERGYRAFVAERGTFGYFTNESRVVSFQVNFYTIKLSGCYLPSNDGTGWRISDDATEDDIDDALIMGAPEWASKSPTYTTHKQYADFYQKSCKFTEVTALDRIKWLVDELERELFTTDGEDDYYLVVDLITKLANACHEYEGETEDWCYINDCGHATPEGYIVGAHWHGAEWHGGQSCPVYAMISATGQVFNPGMTNGPEPDSSEHSVYEMLEQMAQRNQDKKVG
jgi:hypothetical protein